MWNANFMQQGNFIDIFLARQVSCTCVAVEARRLVKIYVLTENPSTYHSEVVKVRKMFGDASISGFYRTMSVNAGICRHVLVKVRFV